MGIKKASQQIRSRFDSWVNAVTGLGYASTDKIISGSHGGVTRLTDSELENLWNGDPVCARIVGMLPTTAFRQGVDLVPPSSVDAAQKTIQKADLDAHLSLLSWVSKSQEAATWGRLFGGAALFLGADDGLDLDLPLVVDRVKSLGFLKVLDRRDLHPVEWYTDPTSPKMGDVSMYRLRPLARDTSVGGMSTGTLIHESRLVLFGGALTSGRKKPEINHWDYSVLQRVYDTVRADASNWGSIANMISDSSQGVLKVEGLWNVFAGDGKELFEERLAIINLARWVGRIMPIDTSEDFNYVDRTFTGIPDIIDKFMLRVAMAAEMPSVILWGMSPAGLSATGESDTRSWYDTVVATRTRIYTPAMERVARIAAAGLGLTDPHEWSVSWPSLWQRTENEEQELRGKITDMDIKYIQAGVLDPQEVRAERFGGSDYSYNAPSVDVDEFDAIEFEDQVE